MNEESRQEAETLRSEIDVTRQRMDDTMDALGNRLQGRHLIDEALGFFRRRDASGNATTDKVKQSADAAFHSVVDTIKSNPLPTLAIGASIGWLIYSSRRQKHGSYSDAEFDTEYDYNQQFASSGEVSYDPSVHYDRPLEYPSGGKMEGMKQKASEKLQGAKEKLSQVGEQARGKMQAARQRAGEMGARARERTREAYSRSRDRVVTTADERPFEVGLGCLALGLVAGLLLPTPEKVNRMAGGRMDRLRDRTRDAGREMMEKGKRVAQAASEAVQNEAQAQGLTFDGLREKAGAVADRAKDAATETARQQGIAPGSSGAQSDQRDDGNLSGSASGTPTAARPAI